MKKTLFTLFTFVAISCSFYCCSNKPVNIIGSWKLEDKTTSVKTSDTKTTDILTYYLKTYNMPNTGGMEFRFTSDSLFYISRDGKDLTDGKFTIAGDKLTVKDAGPDLVFYFRFEKKDGNDLLYLAEDFSTWVDNEKTRKELGIDPSVKIETVQIVNHFKRIEGSDK